VYYDGVWYGDWSVFSGKTAREHRLARRLELFEQHKAWAPFEKPKQHARRKPKCTVPTATKRK
jgi:hypothetical protein